MLVRYDPTIPELFETEEVAVALSHLAVMLHEAQSVVACVGAGMSTAAGVQVRARMCSLLANIPLSLPPYTGLSLARRRALRDRIRTTRLFKQLPLLPYSSFDPLQAPFTSAIPRPLLRLRLHLSHLPLGSLAVHFVAQGASGRHCATEEGARGGGHRYACFVEAAEEDGQAREGLLAEHRRVGGRRGHEVCRAARLDAGEEC
jgi:hypothetical protein